MDKVAERTDRQPPTQQQQPRGRSASSQVQSSNSKCRRPSNSSSGTEGAAEPPARRRRHNNDDRATGCRSPIYFRRRKRPKESRQRHRGNRNSPATSSSVAVSNVGKPKRHRSERKRVDDEDVENGRSDGSSSSPNSSDSWTSAAKSTNASQNSDSPTTTQRKLAPLNKRFSKKKRLTTDRISDLLNMLKNNNKSQKIRRKKKYVRHRRYDVSDDSVSDSDTDNSNSADSDVSDGDSDDEVEDIRFSQPEKWMKYFVNMYDAKKRQRISDKKRQTTTMTTAVATAAAPTDKIGDNQDRVNSLMESVVATLEETSTSTPSATGQSKQLAADSDDKRRGLLPTPQPPTIRGPFDEPHFSSINSYAPPPKLPLPSLLDLEIACPWEQAPPIPQAPFLHPFTAAPVTGGQIPMPQPPQQPQPAVFWPPWPPGGDASNILGDGLLPLPIMPPGPGSWTPGFMRDFFDGPECYNDGRETERRHRRRSGGDEQFREERRPVEAWLCRMCDVMVYEPYQTHRYSEDHKKKDKTARRGCQLCKTGAFSNYPDYLKHMDGKEHAKKRVELDNEVEQRKRRMQEKVGSPSKSSFTSHSPDTSTRSALQSRSSMAIGDTAAKGTSTASVDDVVVVIDCADLDASCSGSSNGKPAASATRLSATDTCVNEESANDDVSTVQLNGGTDNVDVPNAVGTEFLVPMSGFFCQLCRKFWPKESQSRLHCSTDAHCQNYERYLAQQQPVPTGVEVLP